MTQEVGGLFFSLFTYQEHARVAKKTVTEMFKVFGRVTVFLKRSLLILQVARQRDKLGEFLSSFVASFCPPPFVSVRLIIDPSALGSNNHPGVRHSLEQSASGTLLSGRGGGKSFRQPARSYRKCHGRGATSSQGRRKGRVGVVRPFASWGWWRWGRRNHWRRLGLGHG